MNHVSGKVHVDFRSNEPIYLQIARQIGELVETGELNVGDQLPTVREMAAELSINFNTVARAYRLLDETRLISTQRGRGTYIWEKPTNETIKILKEEALQMMVQKLVDDAHALGYDISDALAMLEKMRNTRQISDDLAKEQEEEE